MKRPLLIGFVATVALAAGLGVAYWQLHGQAADAPVSKSFYELKLKDANDAPVNFQAWRGKRVVINFWATWCPPCVEEMPEFDRMAKASASKNIEFVGIAIDSPSNVREFTQKIQIGYPLVPAGFEGTELARRFGNQSGSLPFTVVLNEDGQVLHTKMGRVRTQELQLWLGL